MAERQGRDVRDRGAQACRVNVRGATRWVQALVWGGRVEDVERWRRLTQQVRLPPSPRLPRTAVALAGVSIVVNTTVPIFVSIGHDRASMLAVDCPWNVDVWPGRYVCRREGRHPATRRERVHVGGPNRNHGSRCARKRLGRRVHRRADIGTGSNVAAIRGGVLRAATANRWRQDDVCGPVRPRFEGRRRLCLSSGPWRALVSPERQHNFAWL